MSVIANVFGAVSMIIMFASYLCQKRSGYLKAQIFANGFFGLQYLCLGGYSAGITALIGIGKNIWFYWFEKKLLKPSWKVLLSLEIIYLAIGIITYDGLISMIPIAISCIYTWAGWQPNLKITCVVGLLVSVLWIVYDIWVGAYVAIIASIAEAIASVIGYIKKKANKEGTDNDTVVTE